MQTKLKATPGPWAIEWGATRLEIYSSDAATLVATLIRSTFSPTMDDTAKQNARLIAAAPDLYALVEEIVTDGLGSSWKPRAEAAA